MPSFSPQPPRNRTWLGQRSKTALPASRNRRNGKPLKACCLILASIIVATILLPRFRDNSLYDGQPVRPAQGGANRFHSATQDSPQWILERSGGMIPERASITTHPIVSLIAEATVAWNDKLARQSTTLQEAIGEYQLRYGRQPPKGFDKWYAFAKERGAQLIDEYDRITHDVEEFLGMPPELIQLRSQGIINGVDQHYAQRSFTMRIVDGDLLEVMGPEKLAKGSRAADQHKLLSGFVRWLPDMNVTFWAHDGPAIATAGESKTLHTKLARSGLVLPQSEWFNYNDGPSYVGWERMCPSDSKTRNHHAMVDTATSVGRNPFVRYHSDAIDFCQNPEMLHQHSYTIRNGLGPRPTLHRPILSHSKTSLHSDMVIAHLSQFEKQPGRPIAWSERQKHILLWRGATTGVHSGRSVQWRGSQRSRLNLLTNYQQGTRDVLLCDHNDQSVWTPAVKVADINAQLFDVAFVGEPMQCDKADGTCAAMRDAFRFAPPVWNNEANEYKYVFDVDGNAWSGRFRRLLLSGSAVLKSTATIEWWQDRIQPWVHYIPIRGDYSDLQHVMTFFSGYDGRYAHDALAEIIAKAGQQWVSNFWRYEDLEIYMFRLYLEYARVLDRTFVYDEANS